MMELLLLPMVLCFLRVSAFVAFLPPFQGQNVPNTVKLGLVVALTVFWAPIVVREATLSQSAKTLSANDQLTASQSSSAAIPMANVTESRRWILWTWLAAREITFGAAIGWLLGMILVPIRIAGSYVAAEMGLSMASITSTTDSGSGNVLSVVFESLGVLMFYSLSLHHGFLRVFDRLFYDYRVGSVWPAPRLDVVISGIARLSDKGLALAAPMGIFCFITLVVLLYAMKQSPQFNLFTFGMPFRLAAGVIGLLFLFPDMLAGMSVYMQSFLMSPATITSIPPELGIN